MSYNSILPVCRVNLLMNQIKLNVTVTLIHFKMYFTQLLLALFISFGLLTIVVKSQCASSIPCYDYNSFGCAYQSQSCSSSVYCRGYFGCYDGSQTYQIQSTSTANTYCDGYYGCTGAWWVDSAAYSYCRGFQSCNGADYVFGDSGVYCTAESSCYSVFSVYSVNGFVSCSGASSCYDADYIQATSSTAGNIFCEGSSSCASVNNLVQAGLGMYCRGFYACQNSPLQANNGDMWCVGEFSCESATITTSVGTTFCEGQYGCRYASITAGALLYCSAEHSCYQATISASSDIYCSAESACNGAIISSMSGRMYIYGGNGANGMTMALSTASTKYVLFFVLSLTTLCMQNV